MAHPTTEKGFRLSRAIRPARYTVTLAVDLAGKKFRGSEAIELRLDAPSREIVLHAAELEIIGATVRAQGRQLAVSKVDRAPQSETVVLQFGEEVPAGEHALDVEWSGSFTDGLRGLYAAGPLAVTQFEAADARRVFPCFDEPAFKARWKLTLSVPEGAAALSNGAPEKEEVRDGAKIVHFRETPPLSSYLVAMAVGELVSTAERKANGVPVRTWSTKEKARLADFGQDVAVNVLPRLEEYFGLPYQFGKLDQVGVPDFEAGAMENAGLVTYREVALLLDPGTASLPVKKRVAEVVTHELAHQWFGNWVTMAWWDDLWLNEAFATWMAYKIVDQWKPGWRMWLDFDASRASALHLDALRSTHPIHNEVRTVDEATESFDAITYEKGGAVLRMIEGYLGADGFRDGIRAYMKKHGQANAVADDLWGALAEASKQPVVELANAWIRQPGYPLVSVKLEGKRVTLSQTRYFSEPGAQAAGTWPVPMVLRFEDGGAVKEQRFLLRDAQATVELGAKAEPRWLFANGGATGFYRVAYDDAGLAKLRQSLAQLQTAERVQLLSDQWALVRSGHRDVEAFLDLAFALGGEQEYAVLNELVGRLAAIEHKLVAEADRPKLQAAVGKLFSPRLAQVGWEAKAGEGDPDKLARAAILRAVGLVARDGKAIAEAMGRLDRFLGGDKGAIEPNLNDAVVAMAARAGGAARFDQLLARFKEETDPAFKRRYLVALAAFEDPALAKRAQELAFGDTVPLQDFASFVGTLLANRTARDPFFEKLRAEFATVLAKTGNAPMLLRRVVEAMGELPERKHLEQAEALFGKTPLEPAKQAVAQTLERLRLDVALRERSMPRIGKWLASK